MSFSLGEAALSKFDWLLHASTPRMNSRNNKIIKSYKVNEMKDGFYR
jgi:hypothetical protein